LSNSKYAGKLLSKLRFNQDKIKEIIVATVQNATVK